MSQVHSVLCDACGKRMEARTGLYCILVPYGDAEREEFDICSECMPMFKRAIAVGLRRATDGDGRKLIVTTEEE